MERYKQEESHELREKTDKSLEEERLKTDEHLVRKAKAVTKKAEDAIRLNRLAADKERESARAAIDFAKRKPGLDVAGVKSLPHDDKSLLRERKRSDEAQEVEREQEDQVRKSERLQKRAIAEGLLEDERKETDTHLLDERARLDLESEQTLSLLSSEKDSHALTKTALVTRDQFLAVVSHDLRNPLVSISLSAGLMHAELLEGQVEVKGLMEYLDVIERNAANMERMIRDLLDVERMANANLNLVLQRVDICALLRESKILFAPILDRKSFSMTIQTSSEPIFADVDHDKVLQVLSNLIGNALKFTANGGAIELSVQEKANEIEVSVTDNGPGIPDEDKSKIFERFSQLHSHDRRGLGLGLFISKWLVEAHKGRMWVTTEVGKGSTFSFTLPLPLPC